MNRKRIAAWILSLAMAVTLMPATAFAGEVTETEPTAEAITEENADVEDIAAETDLEDSIEEIEVVYETESQSLEAAEDGRIVYTGTEVGFYKNDGETEFGMFRMQDGTTWEVEGDQVKIHYVPKNTTVYNAIHWGLITDENLTKDVLCQEDGTWDLTVSKENCGYGIPVAPIKAKDGATTSDQYYLCIPAVPVELTVINNIGMFKPAEKAVAETDGSITLPMQSDSYNKAFIGDAASVTEENTIALSAENSFNLGKLTSGEKTTVAFCSKKNGTWYNRAVTYDAEAKTLTLDDMPADYSAVEAAQAKVPADLSIYTDESAQAVTDAVAAVKTGRNSALQTEVDAMAQAIEDAIDGLKKKPVITNLSIYDEELMFKVVNAYIEDDGESQTLVFALSAKGYEEVFAGTYDEAIANGNNKGNWIKYSPATVDCVYETKNGVQNDGTAEKYQFRVPVTLNESGTTRVPIVAISHSRQVSAETENPENPDYSKAFTARQLVINIDEKTVRTGNYQDIFEAAVSSSIETMKVQSTGEISTIGTPTANEYTCQGTFTLADRTYDAYYKGTAEDAAAGGTDVMEIGENNIITLQYHNGLGKTPEIDVATGKVKVAFRVKETQKWIDREITIDPEAKTIAISGEEVAKAPAELTGAWKQNSKGWWYEYSDGTYPTSKWLKINGAWYYFKANGYMCESEWYGGYWFGKSGAWTYQPRGSWKKNSTGWWYEDTSGWYAKNEWVKIDGSWYFFNPSGYMCANEWYNGYWLSASGKWTYQPRGSWQKNSTGWWYGDTSGWYAKNETVRIDGKNYTFNAAGYLK